MNDTYHYRFKPAYRYTKNHIWASIMNDNIVRLGISEYAQKNLGSIVYINLPKVGVWVNQSEAFGTIESIKTVSELYAPVSGKVSKINNKVIDDPDVVNRDVYDLGWLIEIESYKLSEELLKLLEMHEYAEYVNNLLK